MEGYLVLIDIDKIQDFILSTPKLKTIVGASILVAKLTSFNYCKSNTMLGTLNEANNFGEMANNDYLIIFFGGGNIKIIFKDLSKAERFIRDLQRCFIKEAPSASFSNVICKFNDVFTNEIIEKAEKELQKIKLSKRNVIYVNTNPIFKLCEICRRYPASKIKKVEGKDKYLCTNCSSCLKTYENYKKENSEILLKDFYDKFLEKYNANFEEEFENIKDKRGFLAVFTMDGNDFREKIKKITTNKKGDECIRLLRDFSESLKKNITSVLLDSLDGVLTKKDVNKENDKMPFRPIIIGGDDICLTIAADKAFKFIQKFNENVLDNHFFKENKITYSMGISITKSHFPFYFSHQISEQLVKNGKAERKNKEINRDTNMLDWEILHSSVFDDLSKIRKEIYDESYPEYPGENYRLTYKPYNFVDRDFKSFKNLKEIIETLKKIIGNSKFKNLRKLVRESKKLSNYEFRKIISKLDEDKKGEIEASLSKLKITTENIWYSEGDCLYNNFLDLVELSDFI